MQLFNRKTNKLQSLNEQLSKLNADLAATTDTAKKGELETQIQTLKSQIDSLSNTQQMDMLRLQSNEQ